MKKFQAAKTLQANLTIVKQIAPADCASLLALCDTVTEEWSNMDYDAFDKALFEKQVGLQTTLQAARDIKRHLSPKLGGVTRWIADKFQSILFLSTELPAIREFVKQEVKRQGVRCSASLIALGDLLSKNDIKPMMEAAVTFLKHLKPLHDLLDMYSDPKSVPLACGVWSSLEKIRAWAERKTEFPGFKISFDHHMKRVKEHHNMLFWDCVRWLNPDEIRFRGDEPIPDFNKMNQAFYPEVIPQLEWEKFTAMTVFEMTSGMHVGTGICESGIPKTLRDRFVCSVGSACGHRVRLVDVRHGFDVPSKPGVIKA